MNSDSLHSLRIDLARRSQWNIGYFCSGFVFWVYAAVVGGSHPLPIARIYWLVGSMLVFPVAVALSRLLRADPFSNGNALGELVGHTHMSVITLTFPVVIAAFVYMPEAMPLVMAIAYCVDFYVMTWAFGTPLFGVHAAVRTPVVTLIWFAWPQWRMVAIPAFVALAYLFTVALIPPLRRRWMRQREAPSAA
jgi:Family of unknown function (DUF7010)